MSRPKEFEKITGLRHVFAAGSYSFAGLLRMWQETAFRHEVLAFAMILALFVYVGAAPVQYAIASGLFLLLLSVEALNTAIEVLTDGVSPHYSEFARDAKDLGSFAVFCLLLVNGGYALMVIYPYLAPLLATWSWVSS